MIKHKYKDKINSIIKSIQMLHTDRGSILKEIREGRVKLEKIQTEFSSEV